MSEKEIDLALFLILNKKEIAKDLGPILREHWFFSKNKWDSSYGRFIYGRFLARELAGYLASNHLFPQVDNTCFAIGDFALADTFITKTTGNYFFKKENLK